MNILIVVPWYGQSVIGGVVSSVRYTSEEFARRGHAISSLVDGDSAAVGQIGEENGRPIFACYLRSPRSVPFRLKAPIGFLAHLPRTMRALRTFLAHSRTDVSVIFYPGSHHIYFYLLKKFFGRRYVLSVVGSDIKRDAKENWTSRWVMTRLVQNADLFIANSEEILQATREITGRIQVPVAVIYPSINPEWGEGSPERSSELPERYILTLPDRDADLVVEAFGRLAEKYPDVHLVMVGTAPLEPAVSRQIESLGLTDRVVRPGDIAPEAMPAVYKGALFGVIPSRLDTYGMVFLEFQLMARALVASRAGALPETITDGFNGYLVPPDNAAEMALKMGALLDNPELCRKMGQNGRRLTLEKFSLAKRGEEYERLLAEIVQKQLP